MTVKLGSLFDGSGGFPLAGALCGIEPVWASEVEPYPIAVTRSRFPNMRHLGDISKVHGGEPAVAYAEVICVADHPTPKVDEKGTAFTLNSRDYKAPLCAAYAMQGFGDYKESDIASGLKARDYKDATDLVCGVDCRNATEYPELNGTLQAKSGGGTSLNYNQVVRIQYIVRRLTPTECARLQGFADWWGHIEPKEAFTDEEYRFWLEVRNTHAAINGKKVQEYTKPQMLTWYNKLHTDSAEYKMWGNGIALPPALYVMQGISDALYPAPGSRKSAGVLQEKCVAL